MIYTMERRHYFGSGPSGDLPEGKLVYSCKAKKEASAYCKAHGIEPQPRFIAPEED